MSEGRFNTRAGRVCPYCHKKIRRTDSYSQPGDGSQLYHFACWYADVAIQPSAQRGEPHEREG